MANEDAQITDSLAQIQDAIDEIASSIGTPHGYTLVDSHTRIHEQLNSLAATNNAILNGDVDYSDSVDKLCQLLAYGDVLLLVLIVFLAVGMGIYTGTIITRWLKTRG